MTELSTNDWPEETPIPLWHPLVPDDIRLAVGQFADQAGNLHRVPTGRVIEWWLFDLDGELLEIFWLED
ncbi:hypothetical protein [Methylomonas sp. HYX-M1]|uniref:hypothetical protein n=1 Tax=Methylomonas sp. HYX-M1 TaxID=3139307 RepID=UPI00345BE2E7